MRTIIAGSRSLGYEDVCKAMDLAGWVPTVVISGTARGVDTAGEMWAYERHIPIERFPAGSSKGTKHMIDIAEVRTEKERRRGDLR